MPPVAVHDTAVFELPVTVAENCRVCPVWSVALVGEIATETTGGAGEIVRAADALLVESAEEVAVTVKLPAVDPAVNNPPEVIVPPVALHDTAVFELPVTVAENCRVCPGCRVALVGKIEI